jgi:hypothetical protein
MYAQRCLPPCERAHWIAISVAIQYTAVGGIDFHICCFESTTLLSTVLCFPHSCGPSRYTSIVGAAYLHDSECHPSACQPLWVHAVTASPGPRRETKQSFLNFLPFCRRNRSVVPLRIGTDGSVPSMKWLNCPCDPTSGLW